MIFRFDDISPAIDRQNVWDIHKAIALIFPKAEVWYAVNQFARKNEDGSVYPGVPFKDKETSFFYNVDAVSSWFHWYHPDAKLVSHGLIHADHSRLQFDAQEMSILTSCNLLNTNIFVPPFNRYNETTRAVCRIHKISMTDPKDWKNLEYEQFDPSYERWYLHPWRWTPEKLKHALTGK